MHPVLPYVLTSSDDMLIKLWDWDKGWSCVQVFEGHSHYVMQVGGCGVQYCFQGSVTNHTPDPNEWVQLAGHSRQLVGGGQHCLRGLVGASARLCVCGQVLGVPCWVTVGCSARPALHCSVETCASCSWCVLQAVADLCAPAACAVLWCAMTGGVQSQGHEHLCVGIPRQDRQGVAHSRACGFVQCSEWRVGGARWGGQQRHRLPHQHRHAGCVEQAHPVCVCA